jgi:hypothetical protein
LSEYTDVDLNFRAGVAFGCGWLAGYLNRLGMHEAARVALAAYPVYEREVHEAHAAQDLPGDWGPLREETRHG